MLNSFSQMFSFPSTPTVRRYQQKPALHKKYNLVQKKILSQSKRDDMIFQGILDFLTTPIEHWALQYQKIMYNFALHQWIYNQIVSFSTSFKEKLSAGVQQNQMIQQIITQIRIQQHMKAPAFRKPKISLHNVFVMMTQYKIMELIIYDLNTQELQMLVDGLSFIYYHGVGKVQNIGEILSEEEIMSGIGGWGTIDQLTCCIHFITTHTKLYKSYPQKQKYSLMKQIEILKMPNFIRVYDCLQTNKKIDNIVNSIPMFMQFLQIFVKHKNNSIAGCQFVMNVKWLSGLGFRIMEIIQYNINKLLLVSNQCNEEFSPEQLEIIGQLQNLNQQNQKQESQIVLKLTKKAMLLRQTQGRINPRILFSYAYNHLYTVNFMIKLTKKVLELSKSHYKIYKETCQNVSKFLHKLFQCVFKYQFTLPETSITQICEIIKTISNQGEYLFGNQEKEVKGFDFLYSNQINSSQLKKFVKQLQNSQRFGHYMNNQIRPKITADDQMIGQQIAEDFNVMLTINEQSMFYYILSCVYEMKLDYLEIIYAVLKHSDRRFLPLLQYFFIKNELLHFLIESQHEIQLKDKKHIKIIYNTIALLIKSNLVAYAILNQIIIFQTNLQNKRNYFIEDTKKYFSQTKELLLTVLSDAISINMKNPKKYSFCPEILQRLVYPSQEQISNNPDSSSKHEVWISYISNVILHELFVYKKKIQEIEKKKRKIQISRYENLVNTFQNIRTQKNKFPFEQQIYDWITFILLLHIDYTQSKAQEHPQQILLAQFVMTYLTTILSQAIKWKYKDQGERMIEFMKMLEDWENYYTDLILSHQSNEDPLEKQFGSSINFLYLKRWNKKIIKAIKIYLQSMEDYNRQSRFHSRQKRKSLEKVRSLKNLLH